jgi:peptidoglycan/LPS O-acetylase OafA/YrhL
LRLRPPRPLKAIALLANLGLFAMGLYFELHPRDREDAWSAAGVAAVALLNSAALTVPAGASEASRHSILRLRRIARIVNVLLLLVGVAIVVFEVLNDGSHALVHGAALVLPPFFTLLALHEQRRR